MPSLMQRDGGPTYWRSLDQLADTPEFRKFVQDEFPSLAHELVHSGTRRQFLKIMGASLALAGLTACRWPKETIVPATKQPVDRIPGVPVSYASAFELGGVATGVLVTSYDGRPIKIEGNDKHPFSRGKSTSLMQAAILEMYDPDRSVRPVERRGNQATNRRWDEFNAFAKSHFAALKGNGGRGLCVLAEPTSSPSFADVKARFTKAFPRASWHEYEPISRDNERDGAIQAFGKPLRAHVDLTHADVIVSLDSDFLMLHPASLKLTRDFVARRRGDGGTMNRLYAFESNFTITGSNADKRFAVRSGSIAAIAAALHAGVTGGALPADLAVKAEKLAKIVDDLKQHNGAAVVIVGPAQPPAVHALAHAINHAIGAFGKTVVFTEEAEPQRASHTDSIKALTAKMSAGEVDTLVILEGNPAYDAPADLGFAAALAKVKTSIRLGLYDNETSLGCTWHAPRAHWLEAWGDARAFDGTLTLQQPLIEPLFGGLTPTELLAMLAGESQTQGYDIVRRTFFAAVGTTDEEAWKQALHTGLVENSAWKPVAAPTPKAPAVPASPAASGFELVLAPDYRVWDGRFANNGWLQELPDPLTKITWDNAALLSPADATRLGVKNSQILEIKAGGKTLRAPAFILPGHASGSISLSLGYGRGAAGGKVAQGYGVDAYPLRSTGAMWILEGVTVTATGDMHRLVTTQDHHAISSSMGDKETEERSHILIREQTIEEYKADPEAVHHHSVHLPIAPIESSQLFKDKDFNYTHRWGMAIDLSSCIGCGACMVACQSENNIPVVGREEVYLGREMHWIRVDRYFKGDPQSEDVEIAHQPMTCVHCENAPCEQVCPVAATVHDTEGLNTMVYNRCIGTRYCSNNCPYKVRRFNWYYNHYGPHHPRSQNAEPDGARVGLLGPTAPGEPLLVPFKGVQTPLEDVETLRHNPKVTVRSRGVMEKCTYCTHRINDIKIKARNERWDKIPDGLLTTACAQACPADAIVFGDLNDPESRVSKLHKDARAYAVLEELNVQPRTLYLTRLRNPGEGGHAAPHGDAHGHSPGHGNG